MHFSVKHEYDRFTHCGCHYECIYLVCIGEHEEHQFLDYIFRVDCEEILQLVH